MFHAGIIATSPGASLTLQLDTTLPGVNVSSTAVVLTYLTSYERMGMAHVECLSGCSCEPQLLDAHRPSAPEGADESGKHKKGTNGVQTPVTYPGSRGRAVKATRTVSASAKVAKLGAVSTSHTAFIPVSGVSCKLCCDCSCHEMGKGIHVCVVVVWWGRKLQVPTSFPVWLHACAIVRVF